MEVREVNNLMLNEYLVENYGYDEPIFTKNLNINGMSKNALRQALNRMFKSGRLAKFDTGVYYILKPDRLLKTAFLDTNKVIIRKYITNGKEVYGYFTDLTSANLYGLTTQVPAQLDVCSNKETSKGRIANVGKRVIRLKKSRVLIDSDNYRLLQFLDLLADIELLSDLSQDSLIQRLKSLIAEQYLNKENLKRYIEYYPGPVAKRLIEWELIYEFT